ncbi:MAG: V-type ATP synthase subunit F [Acidimicrobiia bacterium]|jgi:vacuolar-type H+-ATPase subunit F/Vma7
MSSESHLVIVTPPELDTWFRLAGAETRIAEDADSARSRVEELLHEGERGVVAVYEPFFAGFERGYRERLELSVAPVVVPLPSGIGVEADSGRRARLAARLQRAVGYHVTFGEEER